MLAKLSQKELRTLREVILNSDESSVERLAYVLEAIAKERKKRRANASPRK